MRCNVALFAALSLAALVFSNDTMAGPNCEDLAVESSAAQYVRCIAELQSEIQELNRQMEFQISRMESQLIDALTFTSIIMDEISTINEVVPSGAVVAFYLANGCPNGWEALPELAGRVIVGVGQNFAGSGGEALTQRRFLETGGEERVAITVEELPPHSHAVPRADNDVNNNYVVGLGDISWDRQNNVGIPTAQTGDGRAHNNMQPYIALHYCRKS